MNLQHEFHYAKQVLTHDVPAIVGFRIIQLLDTLNEENERLEKALRAVQSSYTAQK